MKEKNKPKYTTKNGNRKEENMKSKNFVGLTAVVSK